MTRTCRVDDCDEPARARGLCDRHYSRARRRADFRPRTVKANPVCEIAGCGRPRRALGLCDRHYHRRWQRARRGDDAPLLLLALMDLQPAPDVPLEVFMARQRARLVTGLAEGRP